MKRKMLSIAAVIVIVLGLGQTTQAEIKNNEVSTTLTGISGINKIEIYGNVEVYVSTGTSDKVKVYNQYYAESALVQNKSGVLRISSYAAQKLVVWVTANDLRAISAYDNAEVKSFGSVSAIELEVNLFNNASAKLNLSAYHAKISVNDHARADLSGTADEGSLNYSRYATVNASQLNSDHLVKTTSFDKSSKVEQLVTL